MKLSNNSQEKMSKQAIWDVATEVIVNYLKNNNYEIKGFNSKYTVYPNIVAKKDDKLYGILIDADEVRNQPKYSIRGTFDMLRFAREFNAIPLYASVGLGSANHEKFDNHILVDGDPDGYYVNFEGFDEIDYNIIDIIKEEDRYEYIINLFGYCYETCDFFKLEKYLADNCKWYSPFSGYKYNSKNEIMDYYIEKSKVMRTTKINYFLIKYIGNFYKISNSKVMLPDGTVDDGAIVRVPQPDGEIGLVVEQVKNNDEKVGMAITIGFNDNGLINEINLSDPYDMNFEDYYKIN